MRPAYTLIAITLGPLLVTLLYRLDLEFFGLHLGLHWLAAGIFFALAGQRALAILASACLFAVLVPLLVLHADNFHTYGPLLRETVNAIYQTSGQEAAAYLTDYTSAKFLPTALTYYCVLMFLLAKTEPPASITGIGLAVIGVIVIIPFRTLPIIIYETAAHYRQHLVTFSDNRDTVLSKLGPVASDFKGDVIVVMGESLSRAHLGIYGYPRQTTPGLQARRNDLDVFRDVISTHSHTNESLSRALTLGPRSQQGFYADSADLLGIANTAGLKTYWLSNQNSIGVWDNVVAAMAAQAQVVRYHDPGGGFSLKREVFDDAMLESLDAVLNDGHSGGRVIFLHLMAVHFPYCDIVPPTFEPNGFKYDNPAMDWRFFGRWLSVLSSQGDEEDFLDYFTSLNCYDRGVNYVDQIVDKVIERVEKDDRPSVLLLTGDHGEAPLLNNAHDSRIHSHFHVEVPFVVWQDKAYRSESTTLEFDSTRAFSLVDFSYSVLHLAKVLNLPELARRSPFSPEFESVPRLTMNGTLGYDLYDAKADHVERARANLFSLSADERSKIWLHRVNSGATMIESGAIFSGVEMDIMFENDKFDVYHPPAASVGLTLEAQLRPERPSLQYWLDWKNADAADLPLALERLNSLNQQYGIKSNTLVESGFVDQRMNLFAEAGWRTSYYLPTPKIAECMQSCSDAMAKALADELWQDLRVSGYQAISFDYRLMPFVRQHMLEEIRTRSMPTYTWALDIDISTPDANTAVQNVLKDEWLDAVLVGMPSYFWL